MAFPERLTDYSKTAKAAGLAASLFGIFLGVEASAGINTSNSHKASRKIAHYDRELSIISSSSSHNTVKLSWLTPQQRAELGINSNLKTVSHPEDATQTQLLPSSIEATVQLPSTQAVHRAISEQEKMLGKGPDIGGSIAFSFFISGMLIGTVMPLTQIGQMEASRRLSLRSSHETV